MVTKRSPARVLVKVLGALALVASVAFLIMRTARSARSEPYTLPPEALGSWTLSLETPTAPDDPTGPVLVLLPPRPLSQALFDQTFKRAMESMRAPDTQGIALALQGELARPGAARITPDELLQLARRAGLESAAPAARCVGHRHLPEPDTREQAFFAIFDSPAFVTFRKELGARLGPSFDAGFVSPVMFIGIVESSMSRWQPLHIDPETDCLAPIVSAGR
ncbi:MAG: hypothetical protein JWM82_889 [Myxococcales bacterium]|nr:hypothetical protein [Myxococcales bacterium]